MQVHEYFKHKEINKAIFGVLISYENAFEIEEYLEKIIKYSALFILHYYKQKKNGKENKASKYFEKILKRGYLTNDSVVSLLSFCQENHEALDELGLSELKIINDENFDGYFNMYECKNIVNDTAGSYITIDICNYAIQNIIKLIPFILNINIINEGNEIYFVYNEEKIQTSDLIIFKQRKYYMKTLVDVIPTTIEYKKI